MLGLTTLIAAVIIFGTIILFHEFGHFIVARLSGVTVNEFSIGMGPAVLKKEKNGTLYALRALPVGGFVALEGEDDNEEEVPTDDPNAFSNKPLLPRILILLAGVFNNLLLGYLILVLLTAMNGYVGTTRIVRFNEGALSADVLQAGDVITALNGHRVYTSNDISYEFLRDEDGVIDVTVRRDGETLSLPVQFPIETYEGQQFITIDFKVAAAKPTALQYVTYPFNWGLSIVKEVWGSLIDLLRGRYAINQLSGPVGVITVIGEATKLGLRSLLEMAAFITINVGVFNLLPIPILDGGRVVIEVLEELFHHKINEKIIRGVMTASACLMIALMVYVTYQDIFRIVR
jgi:regulator of sigma E protease